MVYCLMCFVFFYVEDYLICELDFDLVEEFFFEGI